VTWITVDFLKLDPLSSMAMNMLLKRVNRKEITVHGLRSTFRDWASEQTSFPHETCEHALAHRISDKAEAAYRRGDQFEKRRKLMEAWAAFCEQKRVPKVTRLNFHRTT
jgi:integrase